MDHTRIKTLGQLKSSGYVSRTIGEELRHNLVRNLRNKVNVFAGIWGYEDTVIPEVERAILAGHNMNLLGLRGQAKTRLARMMVKLLDEWTPVISGSELNEDPLNPITNRSKESARQMGDDLPVSWLHRDDRYTEKLATPDVSVADLIGDIDPIKAASMKLSYADEQVIHFGLIPRSHRCIFVINELPDLQARIQVSLFNILQEGDIQIRGFKIRLPLDIRFVFTANPEDYTNRGSIVTPLKDRIGSQIVTHYPRSLEIGMKITRQEAMVHEDQQLSIYVSPIARELIEQVAIEARQSEWVDAKSGVSARLTISAIENLLAAAERRKLINGEDVAAVRVGDLNGVIPAITGKVELVYEGEQEGPAVVARNLIGKAIRTRFKSYFPDPDRFRKSKQTSPYKEIIAWFDDGHVLDLLHDQSEKEYAAALRSVPKLEDIVRGLPHEESDVLFLMEFLLFGLAEYSLIGRQSLVAGTQFHDLVSGMFTPPGPSDLEDEESDDEPDDNR